MKGLPPSLKEKNRYIAVRLISEKNISKDEFFSALRDQILSLYGEFGYFDFKIIQFENNSGIIHVKLKDLEKTKNAITLISEVNGVKVLPVILGVSGTIKSCRRKYLGGD